jgi:hypothetical protein
MSSASPLEVVPVLWVFWGWVALSLAYFSLGAALDPAKEAPQVSPFETERSAQARYREMQKKRFGWRGFAYLIFANAAGGVLLYLATAGKVWAIVLFAPVCLWLIYDNASTPFALREMHPRLVNTLDWTYFAIGVVIWVYAFACIEFSWLGKLVL